MSERKIMYNRTLLAIIVGILICLLNVSVSVATEDVAEDTAQADDEVPPPVVDTESIIEKEPVLSLEEAKVGELYA